MSDRIMCVLVNFYMWGHVVMFIIKSLHLISVHFWRNLILPGSRKWDIFEKYLKGMPKSARKPLTSGRSGDQYIAMVTLLIIAYCRTHLVEYCCQELRISDTNRLRYLSFVPLMNIWSSIWRHQLANLHI